MLKAVYYLQEGAIKWKNLIEERNLKRNQLSY